MNTRGRLLATAGAVLAVVIGTGLPAAATFSAPAALPTVTVSTLTVAAPSGVELTVIGCSEPVVATVDWGPSASPGVTGYRVSAHLPDGSTVLVAQTDAATLTASVDGDQTWTTSGPRFTVTTLTGYGWTAPSEPSAVLPC